MVTEADGMRNINIAQRHVLIDLFFNTPHLDIMRQSIHRLSFEGAEINQQSEFLLASICCLAALYVSESDVCSVFNGESSAKLSQRLADVAQKCSRDTSDQPTGTGQSQCRIYLADIFQCHPRKPISFLAFENSCAALATKHGCTLVWQPE